MSDQRPSKEQVLNDLRRSDLAGGLGYSAHNAIRAAIEYIERASFEPKARVITPVFELCNAYESGFGHGMQGDEAINPYPPRTQIYEAYQIGYEEGYSRSKQKAASTVSPPSLEQAAERLAQHIYAKEASNCKTLDEAVHHRSNWRRAIPEAMEMLTAAGFTETKGDAL